MVIKNSSAEERFSALSGEKARLIELLLNRDARPPEIIPRQRRIEDGTPIRLPASGAQQRLWFIDKLEGGGAYHISIGLRLRGGLNATALQAALDDLLRRHEILRTGIIEVEGVPMQEVAPHARFPLQRVDLSAHEPQQRTAQMRARIADDIALPFILERAPLIRGTLIELSAGEHTLLITIHHIASDGWSLDVLIRELSALYQARCKGLQDGLPALEIQYADYAHWQREWLHGPQARQQLSYWKEQLRGAPDLLELPTDRRRPAVQSYRGAAAPVEVDPQLGTDLRRLARQQNVTLAMTMYAAWSIVLARLSGQQDLIIGMPVANRNSVQLEGLIGLFVNTLPIRVRIDDDLTVAQLLTRVKAIMLGAYSHQGVPFERLVEALQPARSLAHSPLFQVTFALRNTVRPPGHVAGLELQEEELPLQTAQFDLSLSLQETTNGISGSLVYATDLFEGAAIERWVECFVTVLRAFVRDSQARVDSLPLLSDERRRQILDVFNATEVPRAQYDLLHGLFEHQVASTPDTTAVVHEGRSLTYAELNAKANQLAHLLIAREVGPNKPVGICVERSIEMIVGLLGIWKAGGAYVPLDPDNPRERLASMLQDAVPRVVLTQRAWRAQLPGGAAEVIELDGDWSRIAAYPTSNLPRDTHRSDQLAYVIYTSGSTGKPKGVMIEHRNVLNLYHGLERLYGGSDCQLVALNASFNFDASVQQLVQLLAGRTVWIVPANVRRDPALLLQFAKDHKVHAIDCTPSQLKLWVEAGLLEGRAGALRAVLVGGEAIDPDLWLRLAHCATVNFYNVYGPTECAVDATVAHLNGDTTAPHIGRPMQNRRVYVVDRSGQPVPIGIAGQICIGGAGVGRGYLNDPARTAECFVPDPYSPFPDARMYLTGDLGRWRPDGNIEYLGRNDQQVKIRGYRIELGDIEAQLLRHPCVAHAVVLVREDAPGEKRLVAYVVPQERAAPAGAEQLRQYLKELLPEYMVPSAFVKLERLPQTPSGKLDRRALPAPELGAYASRDYLPPQGQVEEILAGVWQALLRLERVGRHDNFFELGGHSLLIVQMMDRLRRVGLSTDVRRVFQSATLAELAQALTSEGSAVEVTAECAIPAGCTAITPQMLPLVPLAQEHIERIVQLVPGGVTNVQDIYPLVPLQEGILFHHLFDDQGGDTYVLPTVLSVASRGRLDELIAAMQAAIDRHDVLRTSIAWEQLPQPVQLVQRQATLPVVQVTLDPNRSVQMQIAEWIEPHRQRMDLRRAPLMQLQVAKDPSGEQWYAMLQTHHMTSDHVTWEAVVSEIVAKLNGRPQPSRPSPPFRAHVAQTLAYRRKHDADAFFRGKLADIDEPTAPFGLLDVHGDGSGIAEARQDLEPALARGVRTQARRLGVTAATLFHAAWGLVVAHTSGKDDVVFGSVLLGRLQGTAGVQLILGMFINTLPLRLQLTKLSVQELVEVTQRELVELLMHEQASLAAAQRCSGVVGSAPLFTSLLNYRHSTSNSDAHWSSAHGIRALAVQERTNYPITVSVDDMGQGFVLNVLTDQRIDPHRVTNYLHTAMQSLVHALEEAPHEPVLALRILPERERRQIVEQFNATFAPFCEDRLVHELFEAQVERTANEIAVTHDGRSLTYRELDCKANVLARHLRARGIGPDQLAGICAERSLEMIVGLLAVLKAGGAYLPLDPSYPRERLEYMVADAAPRVILTQRRLQQHLPASCANIILLDEPLDDALPVGADDGAAVLSSHDDLLYVIYTSGSTGRPKGTAMPHRAMVNLLEWQRRSLPGRRGMRVLQFAALSFDVAFQETFSTLVTGGTLVLLDEWQRRDTRGLLELLRGQAITRLFLPPLMLQSLAECHCASPVGPLALEDVITAGEQLRISPEVSRFFGELPDCRLHNHYGPTETHVVTALTLSGDPHAWPPQPAIGRPIANARIYVLDAHLQPVPLGVPGEIYIGGVALARGYLGRQELTQLRFVADPFSVDPDARMYRTGDLGRWLPEQQLQYLRRNDDQVKIRGYRIELGEIEARLALHPSVREAALLVREDAPGDKRLVAYVTVRNGASVPADELRAHLKTTLPEYMVPSAFVTLPALPLTPSGKLHRRALPMPELGAFLSREYDPPQGAAEEMLARIWREVLQLDRIGRRDNFFELGGHSLLALRALLKVNQTFGCEFRVIDLYESPTVAELAARIAGSVSEDEVIDLDREAALPPDIVALAGSRCTPAKVILLTGATGFVGRFLLERLLQETDAQIHCLVRARTPQQAAVRLRDTLAKWDLWRDEYETRVVALAGDLRLSQLGLDEVTHSRLAQQVDEIYHCATSMNHLETYAMAKAANVEAIKDLVRLATRVKPKLLNFISTMGVFGATANEAVRVISECSSIDGEKHRHSQGYIASKWVGEKIIMNACARRIPCNVLRLGLVWADSALGRFDELQSVYRVLKSSLLARAAIAGYRYEMPPTPVDYVARAIVFLARQYPRGGGLFHISSATQNLDDVFEAVAACTGVPLRPMPLYEWICNLKRLHQAGHSLPATPVFEFAFKMGEGALQEYLRNFRSAVNLRFDLTRTHAELESAGIVAPVLNQELLTTCMRGMLERDADLQQFRQARD